MFEIIDNKINLGKETVSPFAAEMHYFRIEKRFWSLCFERIKRAGIRLITTPVPWSLHQDKRQDLDFVGYEDSRKDLTVFLELARELGFKVILRPGPCIGEDWPNGGVPEFVTSDVSSLARDCEGEPIALPRRDGAKGGYQVSFMSPAFQSSMKRYMKAFVEVTRNYIHPRGPIALIELDSQIGFAELEGPGQADYNEDMLRREYPPFLMDRYETIKELNHAYKTKYKEFEEVTPPRSFDEITAKSLPIALDWFRFKEWLLRRYTDALMEIYDSYIVYPLFFRASYLGKKNLSPLLRIEDTSGKSFLGSVITYRDSYADVARSSRSIRGAGGFSWGASIPAGRGSADPAQSESSNPISDGQRRYMLASALGSGLKGMNLKMFVDHKTWYGAPLKNDGSVTPGYDFVRRVVESADLIELNQLKPQATVALVGNRLYQWFTRLPKIKGFQHVDRLVNESLPALCRDLARLKIDYDICESDSISRLQDAGYKLVIAPTAEIMAESEQQALVDLAKAGVPLTLFGAMPKYDENLAPCATLANYLKIKTTEVDTIKTVTIKTDSFSTFVYGFIKTTDTRAKKLATTEKGVVAVSTSKKNESVTFLSFDLSTGFDHHKLLFLESFLAEQGVKSSVYCSDPLVDVYLHHSAKKVVVFLIAPPVGELGDRVETRKREVFLKVNLKDVGFKSPNIKISDIFDDPETTPPIKTTLATLADGIPLSLNFPEGKMLLIERR